MSILDNYLIRTDSWWPTSLYLYTLGGVAKSPGHSHVGHGKPVHWVTDLAEVITLPFFYKKACPHVLHKNYHTVAKTKTNASSRTIEAGIKVDMAWNTVHLMWQHKHKNTWLRQNPEGSLRVSSEPSSSVSKRSPTITSLCPETALLTGDLGQRSTT